MDRALRHEHKDAGNQFPILSRHIHRARHRHVSHGDRRKSLGNYMNHHHHIHLLTLKATLSPFSYSRNSIDVLSKKSRKHRLPQRCRNSRPPSNNSSMRRLRVLEHCPHHRVSRPFMRTWPRMQRIGVLVCRLGCLWLYGPLLLKDYRM